MYFLQRNFIVTVQAALVVVYEYSRGDVHRVHQAQSLVDAALHHEVRDRFRDVHEAAPRRHIEPEMFGKTFHSRNVKREPANGNDVQ